MIEYLTGDIFNSDAEFIVNPVNCIGIMGAGLALEFKKRFPEMYKEYYSLCKKNKLSPGILHFWRNPNNNPKWIVNFPTKIDLSDSKLEYISRGLITLRNSIISKKINSINLPALGCGLGNLSFNKLKKEIEEVFLDYEDPTGILDSCDIKIFLPIKD